VAAQVDDDARRRRDLLHMKAVATGLFLAVTVVFVIARLLEDRWPTFGYVRAAAEAGMVGALADWFAVTALFRHPLGIPIPHTAIVPNRKNQLGRGLGTFVQTQFLAPDVLAARLETMDLTRRIGRWLADPEHARRISANAGAVVRGFTEVLDDEDIQHVLEASVVQRLRTTLAAPLAARVVDAAVEGGHHEVLFDNTLKGLARFLDENRALLRRKLAEESPWWIPEPIDNRLFRKLFNGVQGFLVEVQEQPDHPLRLQFRAWVADLAQGLRTDPAMIARGETIKSELLEHPDVRAWLSSIWVGTKDSLLTVADDPASVLRQRVEGAVVRAGRTLQDDPALQAKLDHWIGTAVVYVAREYGHEIADLIATTVERWDGAEASRRIELQVGRDLQFIRINGTVVGGLAGLLIYSLGRLL
jgi:uncharacterized membrane-anchored protein YjiN (DUF445 family)